MIEQVQSKCTWNQAINLDPRQGPHRSVLGHSLIILRDNAAPIEINLRGVARGVACGLAELISSLKGLEFALELLYLVNADHHYHILFTPASLPMAFPLLSIHCPHILESSSGRIQARLPPHGTHSSNLAILTLPLPRTPQNARLPRR